MNMHVSLINAFTDIRFNHLAHNSTIIANIVGDRNYIIHWMH